ncbi:MAG: tetratricopeptide repeat protein, partial [Phycisphaerales bacterium]
LVSKGFPKRLARVFRDEEELPANADLSTQITQALNESKFLIVVCSPRAVESRWVNAEVEHFRKLGRHDKILALLIEGEPGKSFPKALVEIRRTVVDAGPDGTTTTRDVIEDVEPLAADVRPNRTDQKAHTLQGHARLRLLACILGCRFDDLRQREAERRARRARLVGAGLAALMLALSGLTAFAFYQRGEAIERADQLKRVSDFQSQMLSQIDTNKAGIDLMADVRERFAAALDKAGMPEAERTARVDALWQELVRVNATDTAAAMVDRTILRPAINTIDEQFKDDPKTDASLRQAVADLYRTIGLYPAALPLQENALATRRRVLGEEHKDTITSINNMGVLLQAQGKLAEAETCLREALERSRRLLGESHPNTLDSVNNMGALLQSQGKYAEAEPYSREALARNRRVFGEEHPKTLSSIGNLGSLLQGDGRLAEAEPYLREALEKRRRVLGEEHPSTLSSINNMGFLLNAQGKFVDAEPYYREALEKFRRGLGEEHPKTIVSLNNLATLLTDQRKFAEAEPYFRETLEKSRRVLGEEHPDTLTSINNMGLLLQSQGKIAEAEPYYREALEKRRRVLGEVHPQTLISINNMGGLLRDQGKLAEAEPYYREALEKSMRVKGAQHPTTLVFTGNLGRVLQQQGKHQDAIDLLAPAEPAARTALTGGNARRLALMLTTLGRARMGISFDAERFNLAEANLLEAHPIFVTAKDRGPTHKETLECVQGLADLYTAWHAAEPGKGYDAKAAEWKAEPATPAAAPSPEPAAVPDKR